MGDYNILGDSMSVDQKRTRRYCGYCATHQIATWEEMECHLDICEELAVAKYKLKGRDDLKEPPKAVP